MGVLFKAFIFSFVFFSLVLFAVFIGKDVINKQGIYHPLLFSSFSFSSNPLSPRITPLPVAVVGNGDANANNLIDFGDVHYVSSNWNTSASGSIDQYKDGKVNTLDFVVVANHLTK